MKNNEAGEFELVLGNKQLLGGFFVVVILFAVFFVMGYIVGRSSSPQSKLAANSDTSAAAAPMLPARPASGSAGATQNPPPAAEPAGDNAPQPTRQPTTQPAREPAIKTETPAPAAAAPAEPVPGETYLQVMAVKQEEAEVVARTLKAKGFPASFAPGLKGLTRVLVGPYADTASLGKAKAELENSGFHPIVKR
jgi:cell division septation protein DedD